MTVLAGVGVEGAERMAGLHATAFDRPWKEADFAALMDSPGVAAVVAEDEGVWMGLILIRTVADEAEILTLAVAPGRRRGGVGRALVEAGAALSAGVGADRLWLEVAADNTPAVELYRRAGFQVAGRRPGYYSRDPQSSPVDAIVMSRDLNSAAG